MFATMIDLLLDTLMLRMILFLLRTDTLVMGNHFLSKNMAMPSLGFGEVDPFLEAFLFCISGVST